MTTEPGTPQTAAGRAAMEFLQTRAWRETILAIEVEARSARDAEWRTEIHKVFDDPTRPIWPEGAPRFAAMFAILDADTPS